QLSLPAPRMAMGTDIRALRINITVNQGQAAFRLSAVITPGGASVPPKTPILTTTTEQQVQASNAVKQQINVVAHAAPQNLNYPFKLLEIRENDEILDTSLPPTDAASG